MKTLFIFAGALGLVPCLYSQGIVNPGTITSVVSLTNPPGAVTARLTALDGPRLRNHYTQARTTEAVVRAASAIAAPSGPLSSTLSFEVDCSGVPFPQWIVGSQRLDFEQYGEQFYWPATAAQPLAPGGTITATVSGQVSIVDFAFSQAISGGTIRVYPAGIPGQTLAETQGLPAGITRCEFVVPGGQPLVIDVGLEVGSGGPLGNARRVFHRVSTWSGAGGVPADQVLPVALNLTNGGALGTITGTFDILGETEVSLTSSDSTYGGYSLITGSYLSPEPFPVADWKRRTVISGNPSSGAFTLNHLTPSSPAGRYVVQGEAWLKRTLPGGEKAAQFFRTGVYNPTPAIHVPAGGSATVGNAFQIQPAHVRGTFRLLGPPGVAGQPPVLGSLLSAAAFDSNDDGLPDTAPLNTNPAAWLDRSGITMLGAAADANPAEGASASQVLEHQWLAPDVTAPYELALGGNFGAASTWEAPLLRMLAASQDSSSADRYFNSDYLLRLRGDSPLILVAGETRTQSYTVPMGEVCITVRAAPGSSTLLFNPQILWYENGLVEDPANVWQVEGIRAYGYPVTAAGAASTVTLRTVLPAGTYTLRPTVGTHPVSGADGFTSMTPFTVTVPPRGRVCVDNGVGVSAGLPDCIGLGAVVVNGSVTSDGAIVQTITWTLDGLPPENAMFVAGVSPAYSFTLPAGLAPGGHTVTIAVTTKDGRSASFSQQVTVDVEKPTIACPDNMVVDAPTFAGGTVQYPAPVATDDCGSVSVICNPPSGSYFFPGVHTVTCTAIDRAGNEASCAFTITLLAPCPPPVRSHRFTPGAGTHFQYPDKPDWHSAPAMTVSAWVKRDDAARCEAIISQNFQQSFWFGFCGNALRFYRSGGHFADSDRNVPAGQWSHVAVSYDGLNARFYIDGAPAGVSPLLNNGTGNTNPITIGGDFTEGGFGYGFSGLMDEILLYNRSLYGAEFGAAINREKRTGLDLAATFGSGGAEEDLSGILAYSNALRPSPVTEGILPKWLVVPRTTDPAVLDGEVDLVSEYAYSDIMVIRYQAGAAGIRDALAYFTYRDEPGNRALYIGVKGLRDVVAPWTRDQSFVSVMVDPNANLGDTPPVGQHQFRFNSRRLDGSLTATVPASGRYERGDGAGNYTALTPGDALNGEPTAYGLIGAGGDSVEFRFELATLIGGWNYQLRLGLAHHWISAIGDDSVGPVGMNWVDQRTWASVVFSRGLPPLFYSTAGNEITLGWLDAACNHRLETSTTLGPDS